MVTLHDENFKVVSVVFRISPLVVLNGHLIHPYSPQIVSWAPIWSCLCSGKNVGKSSALSEI